MMQINNKKNNFVRYLKDEKFVEWKLLQTEELDAYWEEFIQKNPEERENLGMAEKHFRNINLSSFSLSPQRKKEALEKFEQSVRSYRRRHRIRVFTLAAAASLLILVISLLYVEYNQEESGKGMTGAAEYIMGNELESQDIQLITRNQSTNFEKNIHIEVSEKGIAQVKSNDDETEEILIDQDRMNKLIVPYGKRSTLLLADGSKVWLNSGTVIDFPAEFTGKHREIYLISGEIYIEVMPDADKSFHVYTSGFGVKVYGTKFNVSAFPNSPPSVVLVEGKVGLQAENKQEMSLLPNEQAVYSVNGTFRKQAVDVNQFVSWKNGYLKFENAPITEVLQQIERYYNIAFSYDKEGGLKELTCSGKIILSENLDNVMTTLALITSTKYRRENNQIYILNAPN